MCWRMILDHARVQPNPVRDPLVKLPRGERKEVNPPTAEHILAVHGILPARYKLPLLVLDATGMRIGELEAMTWVTLMSRMAAGVSLRAFPSRDGEMGASPGRGLRGRHGARGTRGSDP